MTNKRNKVIRVLLTKNQKEYLEHGLQRLLGTKGTQEDKNLRGKIENLIIKLDCEVDNLVQLSSDEVIIITSMLRTYCSILAHRTIPSYDKRGNDEYKKRAEKKLKSLDGLLKRIEKKAKG